MTLTIISDASYLSVSLARSRLGGYFYLSEKADTSPDRPPAPRNGAALVVSNIIKNVVGSATEAEIAGCYHNGREGCPIQVTLEEMGWKQGTTQITTDNEVAEGFANDAIKQNRTKSIDMNYYWVRCRTRQGQYIVIWRRGKTNDADYFTKHHSATHHQEMRPVYIQE